MKPSKDKPLSQVDLRKYIEDIGKPRTSIYNNMTDQERNDAMSRMFENEIMISMFREELQSR